MKSEKVTRNSQANNQLLYFTSSSVLSDDSRIVFISDATGDPNLFIHDLASGEERQLTHNDEGYLKSYVYFDGLPLRGFGRASISLHSESGTLYYLQGREIRKVDATGRESTLSTYPEDQITAFTHVSADGKRLCVPTTDARALEYDHLVNGRPDYGIDQRVQAEGLYSYLRVFDTDSGKELLCEPVERSWITHVQFAPDDSSKILYNHEWCSDCGIRRMWLFDGSKHKRLRVEDEGCSRLDWVCHEMWERDGRAIIYHGKFHDGPGFIGRVRPDGADRVEVPMPTAYTRYGHFTVGRPGELVSDGYYEQEGDETANVGNWISLIRMDWEQRRAEWHPLCRNSSSWSSQDAHPHPILDHGTNYCYFTSDMDGKRAVYRVPITSAT